MARPVKIKWNEIVAKYQTGQFSINKLAKIYKIDKAGISRYFNQHNITINQQAKNTINALNQGFSQLQDIALINTNNQHSQSDTQIVESNVVNPTLLMEESINIMRKKNPFFTYQIQAISSLAFKHMEQMLNEKLEAKELKNITSSMKDINDTLQVIPKPPAFAQQININKESNKQDNKQELVISYEFLDSKK